ncbi:MAG: replication initiator protein A [Clostridia bacterium]|nr:replication initiator protein A [Clostridia bacterium]
MLETDTYSHFSSKDFLLYMLLLNRLKLSKLNPKHFSDEKGIFIYYTNQQIRCHLRCNHKTATSSLTKLEQAGLIHREYQKDGLPLKIYVNDVFGMHDTYIPTQRTNKLKQAFEPHCDANTSIDIDMAKNSAKKHRENFAEKKKRRTCNPTL